MRTIGNIVIVHFAKEERTSKNNIQIGWFYQDGFNKNGYDNQNFHQTGSNMDDSIGKEELIGTEGKIQLAISKK